MKSIAVYCGSSNKVSEKFRNEANRVGKCLASNGIKVVYGGGNMGLMGNIANSALKNDGEVYGVITEHLIDIEKKNERLNNIKDYDIVLINGNNNSGSKNFINKVKIINPNIKIFTGRYIPKDYSKLKKKKFLKSLFY